MKPENVEVAVKSLKCDASNLDRVKFLQEAAIMAQFKHPNVVTLHGVVRDGNTVKCEIIVRQCNNVVKIKQYC